MNFHLVISPLCFQIFHQPQTRNPGYRRRDNIIVIINIDSQNMYIVNTIQNDFTCYGISHCDGKLYYCHANEGIRRFDLKTKTKELLVPTYIGPFSYISCKIVKLTITVTNSIAYKVVLNCVYYARVLWVNINDNYKAITRNGYCICIDTGYIGFTRLAQKP
jgi:hypothetical protein